MNERGLRLCWMGGGRRGGRGKIDIPLYHDFFVIRGFLGLFSLTLAFLLLFNSSSSCQRFGHCTLCFGMHRSVFIYRLEGLRQCLTTSRRVVNPQGRGF